MKTQEELKQEYEALTAKLKELTEDELEVVIGGFDIPTYDPHYDINIYTDVILDEEKNKFQKKF